MMDLVVTTGPDRGARINLSGARSIGRDSANDLVLHDGVVSGRHALIRITSEGSLELTDLSSKNGTWLNGVRVTGAVRVRPGSAIQIGDGILEILGSAPEENRSQALPQASAPVAAPQQTFAPIAEGGFPQASIQDAGPVSGRDVSISGQQAAGRDLHFHEGFQIRSRMRPSARRLLHWGIAVAIGGALLGIAGFSVYGGELFGTIFEGFDSTSSDPVSPNTDNLVLGLVLFGIGGVISFMGLMMILISVVMRREKVREPIRTSQR